ncbi:MAG: hypothetical protein Q9167_000827 [Letrouitia subvulpina]
MPQLLPQTSPIKISNRICPTVYKNLGLPSEERAEDFEDAFVKWIITFEIADKQKFTRIVDWSTHEALLNLKWMATSFLIQKGEDFWKEPKIASADPATYVWPRDQTKLILLLCQLFQSIIVTGSLEVETLQGWDSLQNIFGGYVDTELPIPSEPIASQNGYGSAASAIASERPEESVKTEDDRTIDNSDMLQSDPVCATQEKRPIPSEQTGSGNKKRRAKSSGNCTSLKRARPLNQRSVQRRLSHRQRRPTQFQNRASTIALREADPDIDGPDDAGESFAAIQQRSLLVVKSKKLQNQGEGRPLVHTEQEDIRNTVSAGTVNVPEGVTTARSNVTEGAADKGQSFSLPLAQRVTQKNSPSGRGDIRALNPFELTSEESPIRCYVIDERKSKHRWLRNNPELLLETNQTMFAEISASNLATLPSPNKLSSLLERDESPPNGQQRNIDSIVQSPIAPPNTTATQHFTMPGAFDTPPPTPSIHASRDEMHPNKVHQSTTKQADLLPALNGALTAPPLKNPAVTDTTPSKSRGSLPMHFSSPGFDFNFPRPESDLSQEAQKIMDSVREEAARIKAQMQTERQKQDHKDGHTTQLYGVGGRKIAQPKGRAGRFSDVHKEQFKKMDSIADHASTWKNKIPAGATTGLKRSKSKAGLDEPETLLPQSKSMKSLRKADESDRLGNSAPGKRMKQDTHDDISAARPKSRDSNSEQSTQVSPAKTRTANYPSVITTPTKASIARTSSIKTPKSSLIPSLSRSASTKTFNNPSLSKTEGSHKYFSSLAKFGSVKSILHRHQPKYSNDPIKVAAGTHLPLPTADIHKSLPSLPGTPSKQSPLGTSTTKALKRVNFSLTPSTKSVSAVTARTSNTASPSKIPQPSYPVLAIDSPNVTTRNHTKIPSSNSNATPQIVNTNEPGGFTFSSAHTINFGPPTSGLRSPNSTIRAVRPSGITTPLAEGTDELKAIPHGIQNKKRKQGGGDETEDEGNENKDPVGNGSPVKRMKVAGTGEGRTPMKKGGKRGVLSLSRLNALARPKAR